MDSKNEKETVIVTETTTRKVCSRAKEHVIKNTTEVTERKHTTHTGLKTAHTGIKFHFSPKKKLTVVKPFSFDTGPKIRKEKVCPSPEKSVGKQKDTGTQPKITKESLKVTKETRSSSKTRSVSSERTPAKEDVSGGKKPCSRCSRHANLQADARTNSPTPRPKSPKPQAQASNATKSPGKALKGTTSAAQTVKAEVHFASSEKKVSTTKGCHSCSTKSKSEDHEALDLKKSPPANSNAEATLPNGLESKFENAGNFDSRPVNSSGTSPEFDSSNGTESALPNGINFHCEYSETKVTETSSSISKSASKIPRKKYGAHSGVKFLANVRKETIPQPFSFETRYSNSKKENIQNEANQMITANMVNN